MDKNTQVDQLITPDPEPVRAKVRPAGQDRLTLGLLLVAALIVLAGGFMQTFLAEGFTRRALVDGLGLLR